MRAFIVLALVAAASAGLLPHSEPAYDYGLGHSTGQIISTNAYGNALSPVSAVSYGTDGSSGIAGLVGAGSSIGDISVVGSGGSLGNVGLVGSGGSLVSGDSLVSGSSLLSGGDSLVSGGSLVSGDSLVSGGSLVSGDSLVSGGSFNAGQVGGSVGLTSLDSVPQTVEYNKQFFHFEAPEEEHHNGLTTELSNSLKKNLQVVFIKAPENNAATNAALQVAKQAIEQKTSIYVLSKENDASHVVHQLQDIQENVQTAPEVRFIKYRTPQDAAIAKQSIQSQYNNIGGSSQNFDGGVAPVLNYASRVANTNYHAGGSLLRGVSGGVNGGLLAVNGGVLGGHNGGLLGGLNGGILGGVNGGILGGVNGGLIGATTSYGVSGGYLPANPLK